MTEHTGEYVSSQERWIRRLSHLPTHHTASEISGAGSTFIADAPGGEASKDCFKRRPFADRVAQAVANYANASSLVLAIYGTWGEGKSTALNYIDEKLRQFGNVVCVRFNPWRFADESQLLTAFFDTLADAVNESSQSPRERAGKLIKDYSHVASLLAAPFVGPAAFAAGTAGKAIGETLSTKSLEDQKRRIGEALRDADVRVVVLMDDIDRLNKWEIQTVFRLVKLSADFDNTAYILAFDDKMVAVALNEAYASSGENAGMNFLEKIVTVPLRLPVADRGAFRDYCLEKVARVLDAASVHLTGDQSREFMDYYVRSLEPRLHTPRVAVRWANMLAFSLPLMRGEVNPVDLMLVEGIRAFYPSLYECIRTNLDVFAGTVYSEYWFSAETAEEKVRMVLDRGLSGLAKDETEAATALVRHLFPGLGPAIGVENLDAEQLIAHTREQRVASKHYIGRYFHYAVLEIDITDREFDKFMRKAQTSSVEHLVHDIRTLVGDSKAAVFIGRLGARRSEMTSELARKMAEAVCRCADIFPNTDGTPPYADTSAEAAWLVGELLAREPDEDIRIKAAVTSLGEAPLAFAEEYLAWRERSIERDTPRESPSKEMEQVGAFVAGRIAQLARAETAPLVVRDARNTPRHFYFWHRWGQPSETADYIYEMLQAHPQSVHDLLRCYTARAVSGGLMDLNEFNALQSVSERANEPRFPVYVRLREIYDWQSSEQSDSSTSSGAAFDERNACQYRRYFYEKLKPVEELYKLLTEDGRPEQDGSEQSISSLERTSQHERD